MVDVLKTAAVPRFFFLSRFVSCYWGLQLCSCVSCVFFQKKVVKGVGLGLKIASNLWQERVVML